MKFFAFPNPVNEVAARLVAAVVASCAIAVAAGVTWLLWPLAYGFVARVLAGPRLSPLALVVTRVVVPRLGLEPRPVAGPPKRFAQGIGAVLSLAALIAAYGLEATGAARLIAAAIAAAALLEASFGFCVGCRIFGWLIRAGLVPERVCLDCADIVRRSTLRV